MVDQDYTLSKEIIKEIGIDTFDYETFDVETFQPESLTYDTFRPDSLDISYLRRGVIGGAVGDALGYAVEFMDLTSIKRKYGQSGITDFALSDGLALISDDTQMTLFTANGLLLDATRGIANERG